MNINNVELERPYKWKELCEALEIKVSEGNSRKKDLRKLESLCRYTKQGQKFIIHEKYETPLEIKETRGGANNHSNKYESLEKQLMLVIANNLRDNDIQAYEDRQNQYKQFGKRPSKQEPYLTLGEDKSYCHVYMFAIDMYEQLGMVNDEYKTNRTNFDKTKIKNRMSENFTIDDYEKNVWDGKGDKIMEYNEYLTEQAKLFNQDFYMQFKRRESEILNSALNKLAQKRLIHKDYCYCVVYKKEMTDENGDTMHDENGDIMYETIKEYTDVEKTSVIENAQATVLNMWDLDDKQNKKYKCVSDVPQYLLSKLNKDTIKLLNGDPIVQQDKNYNNSWKVDSYYRTYKIHIFEVALERFVRLSKEPKLNENYTLKDVNNVVTLSIARTLSNACEKAKNERAENGEKKNKVLEVRANNKDLYIEYVRENCAICEFLTDKTIEELIRLKGDK